VILSTGSTRAFLCWVGPGWAKHSLGLGRVGSAFFEPGLTHWKACFKLRFASHDFGSEALSTTVCQKGTLALTPLCIIFIVVFGIGDSYSVDCALVGAPVTKGGSERGQKLGSSAYPD